MGIGGKLQHVSHLYNHHNKHPGAIRGLTYEIVTGAITYGFPEVLFIFEVVFAVSELLSCNLATQLRSCDSSVFRLGDDD